MDASATSPPAAGGSNPGRRMRRAQSPTRRLTTLARWPLGILLTAWRYLWRTTPIRRRELEGSETEDRPPQLPAGTDTSELQLTGDGAGPMFHRIFRIVLQRPALTAETLMRRIQADLNAVAPSEFAYFAKVSGEASTMRPGDEYIVRMPGPWDGPVRVLDASPSSFRLVTLSGHLEAGQIRFAAWEEAGLVHFGIDTWARSGDRLSDLMYDRLRFAKEVQLHMWTSVLEKVEALSEGRRHGPLVADTRRLGGAATDAVARAQARQAEALDGA